MPFNEFGELKFTENSFYKLFKTEAQNFLGLVLKTDLVIRVSLHQNPFVFQLNGELSAKKFLI